MNDWTKLVPPADLATYRQAGLLDDVRIGARPALIVVDVTFGFTGSQALTMEEALQEFPTACGPAAWEAMPRITALIALFRGHGLPVVYAHPDMTTPPFTGRSTKATPKSPPPPRFAEIPDAIAPRVDEWVMPKSKASCFFQTPLAAYLIRQGVDTLAICGLTTSGCVRASAVDAFSHGFATFVIEDCCVDRSAFAHAANLFDMQAKYARVMSLVEFSRLVRTVHRRKVRA